MTKIIEGKDLANMRFIETEDGLLRRYERKGKFVPKVNQKYWFVGADGSIDDFIYNDDIFDKWCIKHNLIFETREEAEEYRRYLIALDKYSYDFTQEEWENLNIIKYFLCFYLNDKKISVRNISRVKGHLCYFKSIDDIEAFRNEVGDEVIEKFMFGYYR